MKTRNLAFLLVGSVLATVLIYAGALIYFAWPIDEISINKSGVFGDSFGALTSLFSGLAFAGLIITILMQKNELALQREELALTRTELSEQRRELKTQNETIKIQRFENTFFKMLEFLEGCRNEISYHRHLNAPLHSRDAIKKIYNEFKSEILGAYIRNPKNPTVKQPIFREESKTIEGVKEAYRKLYSQYGEELGQYFRTLYNVLKFVEANKFITNPETYTNLLRAQLSRYELSLLFYNCISEYGSEKLSPLVQDFSILKHLEPNTLPQENLKFWEQYKNKAVKNDELNLEPATPEI